MKKVKYWKAVKSNLKLHDALNMLKSQAVEGHLYDYLAIRLGYKLILPERIDELLFSIREMENENWEAIVPDDEQEEILYKVRDLVKNEHCLKFSYNRIDNMDISDIWNELNDIIVNLDAKSKYRIIKKIIENKLYKKS